MSYRNPVRAVGVVGTVTTVAGGTTTPKGPKYRGVSAVQIGNFNSTLTISTPAATVVGDLLVVINNTRTPPGASMSSEWTAVTAQVDPNTNTQVAYWTKKAGTQDAGGNGSYVISGESNGTGSLAVMLAISDGTSIAVKSPAASFVNGGSATVTTPSVDKDALVLFVAASRAYDAAPTFAWGPSGPPTPQPAITEASKAYLPFSSANGALTVAYTNANWTPAASYGATCTNNGNSYGIATTVVVS